MHRVIGLLGGVVAHVDIVLLVGAGGQIVDHGGVREDTQLALKTRGGVLDHHETVVEVGVLVEERRQLAHQAVEQTVDAAVAHFAQIRDRDAEVVGRHTGIGAVGVAAHQRDRAAVLFIEDERVVDGRVELDGERRLRVLDGLFDRAVELRHAADGQRVLHAVATAALKHGAVLQNGADVGRGVDLVGVRAHGHQALVHSHQRTLEHLERERARNVCRQAERLRVIDRKRRERGDGRGAGEQDKAFFGRKHDGLESRALERLCAVKRFALIGGPALADHHHADVALERQIADRAVAGDDGADARVEHVADQRERFKTDARMAGAEVAEHDKHHCARALLGDGLADGAGVGVDVVALDRLAVLFGDELLPVVTKARGQTIDGLALVACSISGISISSFFVWMIPMALLTLLAIYLVYLRRVPRTVGETGRSKKECVRLLLRSLWSLLLAIAVIIVFSLPTWAVVTVVAAVNALVEKFSVQEVRDAVVKGFDLKSLLGITMTYVFKDLLILGGVIDVLPTYFEHLPIPAFLVLVILYAFGTLVAGSSAAAAAFIPLAYTMILDGGAFLLALLMNVSFASSQLSPTHICTAIISDYFGVTFFATVKKLLPLFLLTVLIACSYYMLLTAVF